MNNVDFNKLKATKITDNFSLYEMLHSNTADANGYEEQYNPPQNIIDNINFYVKNGIEIVRVELGLIISTNVGYRCKRTNDKVGGSPTSDHLYGLAGDHSMKIDGVPNNKKLFDTIIACINTGKVKDFNEVIWEHGTDTEPAWVHFSVRKNANQREVLRAYKNSQGKTVYENITKKFITRKF
jgi:hypothetical protein